MTDFTYLKIIYLPAVLLSLSACQNNQSTTDMSVKKKIPAYAMVIHGGAGTILKKDITDEMEKAYKDALNETLDIGEKILSEGGAAIDAVEKCIRFMEESPLFNAGKGSVFTHDGENEMDASIMDGSNLNAGAVGGIKNVKHPISAARAVLEKSEHVMLVGAGAEKFAAEHGIEIVDPSYFYTQRRWDALQKILVNKSNETQLSEDDSFDNKHGTVGVVALDNQGNIVAGTSTGGMTNKKYDRIGDSPIIGAGTYANNATCGVSCTGHGEFFIRYAVAHELSSRLSYTGEDIQTAASAIIHDKLLPVGGTGGLVALDQKGNIAMPFNTEGMYRAYIKPGERVIGIYKEIE